MKRKKKLEMGKKLGKLKNENENGEKIWKIGTIVEKSTKLKIEQNWKKWKWGQKLENWTKSWKMNKNWKIE